MTDTFQWERDSGSGFADITGETASTYTVVTGDVGSLIRVRGYRDATLVGESAAVGPVLATAPAGDDLPVGDIWNGTLPPSGLPSLSVYPHQSFVSGHVTNVANPLGGDERCLQFAINDGDRPYTGATNPRGDFESPNLLGPGDDVWVRIRPIVPATLPLIQPGGGRWFQLCEIYGQPFGGSPPVGPDIQAVSGVNHFGAGRGRRYGYDRIWQGPAVDGAQHEIIQHWYGATDSTGFWEVYFDGVLQTLIGGGTRAHMVTLDPGVNWDGTHGNFLNVNQYRKAGMISGTVTTWHGIAAIGSTYASVSSF